jgi:hypothetical protein
MLTRILILISLCAFPSMAAGQHAAPLLDPPAAEDGVTLTVNAYLLPSTGGQLMVPMALLERLSADDALLGLDTAPVDGRVVVSVRFGFPNVAQLHDWYARQETVRLLQDLRSATMSGSFETFISYRPDRRR